MRYKILSADKKKDWDSKFGPMTTWNVALQDEQGNTIIAEQNTKAGSAQPAGDVEGAIEDTPYGKRFKKAQEQAGGGFKNDPNTRREIIRQNSLTNAVNYVLGKAQYMDKKDALEFISGKEVLQVATYFAKYSEGLVTVVTEKEPTQNESVSEQDMDELAKEIGF